MKSINKAKVMDEFSEKELQYEMKVNPMECPECRMWQSGGDMSLRMFHCPKCGHKVAFKKIEVLIATHAELLNLAYLDVWDQAYELLHKKIKEYRDKGQIYFDEDYFYSDLSDYFINQIKPKNQSCITSKETEACSAKEIQRKDHTKTKTTSPSRKPIKWNLKVVAKSALKGILNWWIRSVILFYI